MSFLITGTGTGIGKTFFSILFMLKYGLEKNWYYWKYIETGSKKDSDYYYLSRILRNKNIFPPVYRFSLPASPHYAAQVERKKINIKKLTQVIRNTLSKNKILLEGAGGVLVPLKKNFLSIDLWKELQIPTIVVTSTTLGTINHTLLTLEALANRGIPILGFYMIGERTKLLYSNVEAIEKFSKSKCLGVTFFPNEKLKVSELNNFAKKNFELSLNLKSYL